jgi:hypothetical protein
MKSETTFMFEATVQVRIRASSKMDCVNKIRMMLATSATPIRDIDVKEIEVIEG